MKKLIFSILIGAGIFLLFSGCVVVTITEDLQNPFIITIKWNDVELETDTKTGQLPVQTLDEKGAVVEAIVEDEYENPVFDATYEWYLNGELVEAWDGSKIELNGTMANGFYWLDLIVGKGVILSSERVEFNK